MQPTAFCLTPQANVGRLAHDADKDLKVGLRLQCAPDAVTQAVTAVLPTCISQLLYQNLGSLLQGAQLCTATLEGVFSYISAVQLCMECAAAPGVHLCTFRVRISALGSAEGNGHLNSAIPSAAVA